MRRTASQVIRELELRVARLERQAGASSELEIVLEEILDTIKRKGRHGPMTNLGENTYTVVEGNQTNSLPQEEDGIDELKDVTLETFSYASVYLDEATTPNLCSRIKNKDRTLIDELNKFFRKGQNSSKIINALEKRGAIDHVARLLENRAEYRNENSYSDGYIRVNGFSKGSISQPKASYETIGGRCRLSVICSVKNTALMSYQIDDDDYDYDLDF